MELCNNQAYGKTAEKAIWLGFSPNSQRVTVSFGITALLADRIVAAGIFGMLAVLEVHQES